MRALYPVLAGILTLTACNSVPAVAPSAPAADAQLKSMRQWQELAAATAAEIAPTLRKIGRPAYVAGDDHSKFVASFRDLLDQELIERGLIVSDHAANAAIINVSTRVARMSDPTRPPFPPGVIEIALAAIVEVPTGMVSYLVFAPDTEVLVTATILDSRGAVWFRKNHIFYVDHRDARSYRATPSMMMTDWQTSPPPALRRVLTTAN